MAVHAIEDLLNSVRSQVPGYSPTSVAQFRFVPLEWDRYYLVASTGKRYYWDLDIVGPTEEGFRFTELTSHGPLPLALAVVDLAGDGTRELLTGEWPGAYAGADTPPIYWYVVWRFRNGAPEDVSRNFPQFYRQWVIPQLAFPEALLRKDFAVNPGSAEYALAEVQFVRLKFRRNTLGEKDAGLSEAIGWVGSQDFHIAVLGVRALAEMTSPLAWREIDKLRNSQSYAVCMEARRAWLRKLHQPLTAKDECPQSNPHQD